MEDLEQTNEKINDNMFKFAGCMFKLNLLAIGAIIFARSCNYNPDLKYTQEQYRKAHNAGFQAGLDSDLTIMQKRLNGDQYRDLVVEDSQSNRRMYFGQANGRFISQDDYRREDDAMISRSFRTAGSWEYGDKK